VIDLDTDENDEPMEGFVTRVRKAVECRSHVEPDLVKAGLREVL
jgi:hypothetical protein